MKRIGHVHLFGNRVRHGSTFWKECSSCGFRKKVLAGARFVLNRNNPTVNYAPLTNKVRQLKTGR